MSVVLQSGSGIGQKLSQTPSLYQPFCWQMSVVVFEQSGSGCEQSVSQVRSE